MFLSRLRVHTYLTLKHFKNSNTVLNLHFTRQIYLTHTTSSLTMADTERQGMMLDNIVTKLEEFAPANIAESWDNVGLLIDPMESNKIKSILLTNDLTEDVMDEALNHKVGMILSYHPPIFKALKSVTARTWKERIVVSCLKYRIALYSPHTSWDVTDGGVNDLLSKAFTVKSSVKLTETGCGRMCELSKPITLRNAIENIKNHIEIPHLRLALARGKTKDNLISSVALCAGAGTGVLAGVKADLYLTGEMLHHDVLDATHSGAHVVLCNHSDSERGFLKYFASRLQDELLAGNVKVMVSEKDSDPLKTV